MSEQSAHAGLRARLFDEIPTGIAVIDRSLAVVDHNQAFASIFGESRGTTCYRATKRKDAPCSPCPALQTFNDGNHRVIEQSGTDDSGRPVFYLTHVTPIMDPEGTISHVAAITVDVTATRTLQQEYQTLFEKVPCFVAVINRDHRVVKANEAFRRVFGEPTGEHCYRLLNKQHEACADCPGDLSFADGGTHSKALVGIARDGRRVPCLAYTTPLLHDGDQVTHVIEMALDHSEHEQLREELGRAQTLATALLENALDATMVLDERCRIVAVNQAAEQLLGEQRQELIGRRPSPPVLPAEVWRVLKERRRRVLHESRLSRADGTEIPVCLAAVALEHNGELGGCTVTIRSLPESTRTPEGGCDAAPSEQGGVGR